MTQREYLAIIEPTESIDGKDKCMCSVSFLTEDLNHRIETHLLSTCYFRYYYYGTALEVVEMDKDKNIINIRDLKNDDMVKFNLSIAHVVSFNALTHDALASNGFVYPFDQSTFATRHDRTFNNILSFMQLSQEFILRIYLINGAVVYIEPRDNVKQSSSLYKYNLNPGLTIRDRSFLKSMLPRSQSDFEDTKRKLSQNEVDEMFEKYSKI